MKEDCFYGHVPAHIYMARFASIFTNSGSLTITRKALWALADTSFGGPEGSKLDNEKI